MTRKLKLSGKVKYPKERLLYELYRVRGLTSRQINKAIIGSYDYTCEYMTKLEKEGYVQGKHYNAGRKPLGKLYTVTDKGIELLATSNFLQTDKFETEIQKSSNLSYHDSQIETDVYVPKFMSAYANNQRYDKHKVVYTLLTNELYAELTSYGMYFYDSRQWKVRQRLNRNAIVRGGFKARTGEEYSLYILFSKEQTKTAHISENMLRRMVEEMNTFPQGGHHVVYVYDDEQYNWIVEQIRGMKPQSNSLHIIRHYNGLGYEKLRLLSDSEHWDTQLAQLTRTSVTKIDKEQLASRYATHEFALEEQTYYLTSYLTYNEGAMIQLEREFTPERSKIIGKKLAILAWESDLNILKERFANTSHIRVRLIPDETIQAVRYSQEKLLSHSETWKAHSNEINRRRRLSYI
ncbi:hypothetical protein ACMGD3_24135 [Lysinibacillus sphaericus]|uniref:hypothetical protein n=1 Tax=Lysinibacillus sphaericus TaxID=1421 RepID=UPI003F7B17E0